MNRSIFHFNKPFSQDSSTVFSTFSSHRLGALAFLILSFFLFLCPDTYASLAQPFTTKLTQLSSQLVLFGKGMVGVSLLIGIILFLFGNPQWNKVMTAAGVGIAIVGFATIKQFLNLGG